MVWGKSLDLRPRSVDDVHSVAVAVEVVRFRTQKPLLLLIFIGEFEWGCAKEMDKLYSSSSFQKSVPHLTRFSS